MWRLVLIIKKIIILLGENKKFSLRNEQWTASRVVPIFPIASFELVNYHEQGIPFRESSPTDSLANFERRNCRKQRQVLSLK